MRGGPTILSGWAVSLSALATRVPERLLGGEGASSALCNLSPPGFWPRGGLRRPLVTPTPLRREWGSRGRGPIPFPPRRRQCGIFGGLRL